MRALEVFFKRPHRPASLRLKNGDAFAACAERLGITSREAEIVRLLLEGQDSKRIGEALFISDHTVKNHIHNIYQKLGIKNRIQLVRCFQSALEDPGRLPEGPGAGAGRSRVLRRAALPAVVLLVGLAAILIAWRPWGLRPRPVAFPPLPALAVLDFENLSGDAELDKWEMGLPLLLATDLGQSRRLRTVSDDVVYGALRKFDLADRSRFTREEFRRLAKEMKADYLINGTLMTAGGRIVVTAFLQDARSGVTLRTDKLDCQDEKDLLQQADALARLIRSGLSRTAAQAQDDIDLDIEVMTTSSALAYKYYSEGWRYHRTGDYEQSLLMLGKAVEIDPEFAMAYRMMAVDARNLRYFERQAEYMRKAFDLAARLPEDCRERHLIRADYYGVTEATWDLAVAEYRKVLEDHPYDLVANNNLGVIYYQLEDYEAAVLCADVPVRQGTSDPFPHYTKSVSLQALGRPEEALRVLTAYHESFAANRMIYQTLVGIHLAARDIDAAAAALDKAIAVFPDPSWSAWKASVVFVREGPAAAREELRRLFLMDEPAWRISAHLRLAEVELATGRYADAEKQFRAGLELAESIGDPGWMTFFHRLIGEVLLERGKVGEAAAESRKAVELAAGDSARLRGALLALGRACVRTGDQASVEELTRRFGEMARASTSRAPARGYDIFLGFLAYEAGRFEDARAAWEKAAAQFPAGQPPDPLTGLYLGMALEKTGDLEGAAKAYREVIGADYDRLLLGDVHPLAVFGLARTQDALGRKAAAAEGYRSFLAMWSDADPERPEVADARTRLTVLAGPSAAGR